LYIAAARSRREAELEQFGNFLQREAQCLSVLDEPKPPFLVLAIDPVSRRQARRRTEQPKPFVVPHCLDIDANRFRELPNSPSCSHLSPPTGPYILYYGTESRSQELILLTRFLYEFA
jgi:hypothetical protein